jgi:hypothetical protein
MATTPDDPPDTTTYSEQVSKMADLAELRDMVEGLRAAAHKARQEGNTALADALEKTRFEVYERYLGSFSNMAIKPLLETSELIRSRF